MAPKPVTAGVGAGPAGGRRGIDYKYRCAALRVDGVLSLLDLPVPSLADPQKHLGLRQLIKVSATGTFPSSLFLEA